MRLGLICLGMLLSLPSIAVELPDPRLAQLGMLYAEGTVDIQSTTCSARFPTSRGAWTAAVTEWKTSNARALAELRSLSDQLEGVPQQAHATTLLLFRTQAVMVPLHALAATTDAQAEQVCARTRTRLADTSSNEAVFQQARASAAYLLASPPK